MRRLSLMLLSLVLAVQTGLSAEGELARRVPSSPLVTIEAREFSKLLSQLRASEGMKRWTASPGYQTFLNTKLALKLSSRLREMESLVGAAFDLDNLATVAGGESALAIYDIGRLQLLMVTKLDPARFAASALTPLKKKFDVRTEGGLTYYTKARDDGALEFAFAQAGEWITAATDVSLLERSAALSASTTRSGALADDSDYARARALEPGPAQMRLHLDLSRLVHDNYFGAYWIHRNVTELGWIAKAHSIVRFQPDRIEERRILLPAAGTAEFAGSSASPASTSSSGTGGAVSSAGEAYPAPSVPAGWPTPYASWSATPGTTQALDAIFRDVLGRAAPEDAKDTATPLSRDISGWLSGVKLDAMMRTVVMPDPAGGRPRDCRGGVLLLASPAHGLTTAALEPLFVRWAASELTGETEAPGIAFDSRGQVRSLEFPFAAGRGIHLAVAPGGLAIAGDPALARLLAGVLELPRQGVERVTLVDLRLARSGFRTMVERALPLADPLRATFADGWCGLLETAGAADRLLEWSWRESGVVRQVQRFDFISAR